MDTAWMLHRNGTAYPVKVHPYVENYDGDLYNAADVASFVLFNTNEKDLDTECKAILISWMFQLVAETEEYKPNWEDITSIKDIAFKEIENLDSSEFLYLDLANPQKYVNLLDESVLDNVEEYLDFGIQEYRVIQLINYINQFFCRVRFGGEYDTAVSNNSIWFRVSSIGFNWRDVIYLFVADIKNKYHIASINIGRDTESDNMLNDTFDAKRTKYFYKAADGAVYQNMPIDEYLSEEHETNPVFASKTSSVDTQFAAIPLTKKQLRSIWACEICAKCVEAE